MSIAGQPSIRLGLGMLTAGRIAGSGSSLNGSAAMPQVTNRTATADIGPPHVPRMTHVSRWAS